MSATRQFFACLETNRPPLRVAKEMRNPRPTLLFSTLLALSFSTVFCEAPTEVRARKIAEALRLQSGSAVADVGAGDGEWSIELAKIVGSPGRVFATEVDGKVLDKLRKAVKRSGLKNVTVVFGDQRRTGLDPECCDALLLRHVYHHFSDPPAMLADMLRSLRPGGLLAVIDFSPDNGLSVKNVPEFRHGHGVRPETVDDEVRRAGFDLVRRVDRWDERDGHFLLLFQKRSGS